MAVMTNIELAKRCVEIAQNYKTLYVMGCFGAPMNEKNKSRYSSNHTYNKNATRRKMIQEATEDTFGFDCVCMIKGILWGWNGNKNKVYGGAAYGSNGVPDVSADGLIAKCHNVSTDFSKIDIGEVVWMSGHIGVYVGEGLAVECTPAWKNKVQITAVGNIGKKSGYNTRKWTKHGKLPYVSYESVPTANDTIHVTYKSYAGKWWPEVVDCNDINANGYAGVQGKNMTALMAKPEKGTLRYRVHLVDKGWLPWVENYADFAGIRGKAIDAVQMQLLNVTGYEVQYRVSPSASKGWYGWCTGLTDASGDGYAGVFSKPIDCIQIKIVKK